MGDGDRQCSLHRLQRLRRRLPGRKQCAGRRPGRNRRRPRHALAADRRLCRRRPARLLARALHALRARALRAGLPGGGFGARQRRTERPGLQPLHRHAVLPVELSRTRCAASTSSATPTAGIQKSSATTSSRRCSIRTSPCAAAASWKSAPIASSASARARRTAEKENRTIRDGEVVTACQAACPTRAITFGDLSDPQAAHTCLARASRKATRCSAISARARARLISRGCKIPIRPSERRRHERSRDQRRRMPLGAGRWTLPTAAQYRGRQRARRRAASRARAVVVAAWWIGVAVSFALTAAFLISIFFVFHARYRHLGHRTPP